MLNFFKKRKGERTSNESDEADQRKSKRNLSVVAIVKNEKDYLIEWLAHHRCLGVEHFYIADNGSDDGSFELLQSLEKEGFLTLTYWPLKEKAQHRWYNHALEKYGSSSRYLAFIDADEFIDLSGGPCLKSKVRELMTSDHAGAVACEWRIHGSSGHERRTPGMVIERFPRAGKRERHVNRHIKSIVKPAAVERMWAHSADLVDGYHYLASSGDRVAFINQNPRSGRSQHVLSDCITVKHYAVKSLQEYIEKKQKKGRANLGPEKERHAAYFENHDMNDTDASFSNEWIKRVKDEIVYLQSFVA